MISRQKVKPVPKRKIGLYGGSFDPPHTGHEAVLRDLLQRHVFDEIWIVPVLAHPFAKQLTDFALRVEMLEILKTVLNQPHLKICTVESHLPPPNYTVNTVEALRKKHPDCAFAIIIGSDVKNDLSKWHRIDDLKKMAAFYFLARAGHEDSPYPQISSSEIRGLAQKGLPIDALVPKGIADYLQAHKLYTPQNQAGGSCS